MSFDYSLRPEKDKAFSPPTGIEIEASGTMTYEEATRFAFSILDMVRRDATITAEVRA